jgi:hypothetical protein
MTNYGVPRISLKKIVVTLNIFLLNTFVNFIDNKCRSTWTITSKYYHLHLNENRKLELVNENLPKIGI